jgi:hypothetical protein
MFADFKYLLFSFFVVLVSCNSSSKKENKDTSPGTLTGGFLTQDFGGCDSVKNEGVSVNIRVWEPTGSGDASARIQEEINDKIVNRINSYSDSASIATNPSAKSNAKAAYDVFAGNYHSFKKEFPDSPGCWEVEVAGDTVMMTKNILVYQFDHYSFTGGAHPNSFRSYHVFDLKTGAEKEAKSFVKDSTALLKKVEAAFRKEEKLNDKADLEESGYFLADHQFFVPANYTFTRKGVFFYYNPYEIAAYVRGPISFTIPYSELKGIVEKDLIF